MVALFCLPLTFIFPIMIPNTVSHMVSTSSQTIFAWILFSLLVFFIGREIVTWYWKINATISLRKEHNAIMEDILGELRTITDIIKEKSGIHKEDAKKEDSTIPN